MASHRVTGIATEPAGYQHEHITDLYLESGQWVDRYTVAVNIQHPSGDRYYTYAHGQVAWVVVVGCPVCAFSWYLRTTADSTTENNLLSLPRYRRAA